MSRTILLLAAVALSGCSSGNVPSEIERLQPHADRTEIPPASDMGAGNSGDAPVIEAAERGPEAAGTVEEVDRRRRQIEMAEKRMRDAEAAVEKLRARIGRLPEDDQRFIMQILDKRAAGKPLTDGEKDRLDELGFFPEFTKRD